MKSRSHVYVPVSAFILHLKEQRLFILASSTNLPKNKKRPVSAGKKTIGKKNVFFHRIVKTYCKQCFFLSSKGFSLFAQKYLLAKHKNVSPLKAFNKKKVSF